MQIWHLDFLSMVSVAVVVAITPFLPIQLSGALFLCEVAFGTVAAPWKYRQFSQKPGQGGDEDDEEGTWLKNGLEVLQKILDPSEAHANLIRSDGGKWFQGWWSGVSAPSCLGQQNVAEFLSYTIFGRRVTPCTTMAQSASQQFISALDLPIHQGNNPNASFIAHTEEPLVACYRPLTFYLLTEAVAGWGHLKLTRGQGHRLVTKTEVASYYMKDPIEVAPVDQAPIIFLHGIGLGLAPYTGFLKRVAEMNPSTILISVQYKHVSMRLTSRVPSVTEVADDVAEFLTSQGISSARIIAHSYGTLVASALTKRHPSLVLQGGLTLIDPVCFAMFLPHLVRKTLHFEAKQVPDSAASAAAVSAAVHEHSDGAELVGVKERRGLKKWLSLVKSLMKGLVVRELHCAAAMCRNFRWTDINLWMSELPLDSTIVLGGMDGMIPVAEVKQMLNSKAATMRGVKLIYSEEKAHGAFLLDPELQHKILVSSLPPYGLLEGVAIMSGKRHQASAEQNSLGEDDTQGGIKAALLSPSVDLVIKVSAQSKPLSSSMTSNVWEDTYELSEDKDAKIYAEALKGIEHWSSGVLSSESPPPLQLPYRRRLICPCSSVVHSPTNMVRSLYVGAPSAALPWKFVQSVGISASSASLAALCNKGYCWPSVLRVPESEMRGLCNRTMVCSTVTQRDQLADTTRLIMYRSCRQQSKMSSGPFPVIRSSGSKGCRGYGNSNPQSSTLKVRLPCVLRDAYPQQLCFDVLAGSPTLGRVSPRQVTTSTQALSDDLGAGGRTLHYLSRVAAAANRRSMMCLPSR
ncbi:hypothetical protein CEUSTIGMA_g1168.t1 [Chlamydomonas eustigma]|uniref:AB hydrolase-1 domain-containing protein n=1 Tax=Chlamydomonas eustigma TaxID=1157962 RepID=A0A250WSA4_9CHLO|nr:hypothetical protein CEUSTIGMA_g1168.t1 [Chlamydomonas eustigma]|eukprot:GAX73715.1 hypothetical protein CEUSTIGMA_g1168.t1 [Chlamydomonas eustigma]